MPPSSAIAIGDDFRQAMERAGLVPPNDIIADGKLRRFSSNGDRDDDAGWYVLHNDGIPAGAFGCFRTGIKQNWCAKAITQMTATERSQHRQRLDEVKRQRDHDERLRHVDAAQRAQAIWNQAAPAPVSHPYLQRKGIQPHGLRVDADNRLIVPVKIDGDITSIQFISPDGDKKFLFGGAIKRGSFLVGDVNGAKIVLLGEGFGTSASLYEASGFPTLCAFFANNLKAVAHQLRQQFPMTTIVVCGDHDLGGTGQRAARDAAEAVNGVVALPEEQGQDFNDLHVRRGRDAVRVSIAAALQ